MVLTASPAGAGWDGTIKLGGIVLDEEGDKSAVQETYDIHDGFSLSQIRLSGTPTADHYVMLNLDEINLDSRRGDFLFRQPGLFRVNASYDQHRQVFDPTRSVSSDRKDFKVGADVTPLRWLRVSGDFGYMNRDGDRLSAFAGTGVVAGTEPEGWLGNGFDYSMRSGGVSAEVRKDRRGFALDWRGTDFTDDLVPDADRTGNVLAARMWAPGLLHRNLNHVIRASYGVSETSDAIDYTFRGVQYTGIAKVVSEVQLKYGFDGQRMEDDATGLTTDRFQHDVDATFYHEDGNVTVGYGYETNDDDRRLTSYQSWRAGAVLRGAKHTVRVRYAGREKKDTESRTLLQEMEASRIQADLDVKPYDGVVVGLGLKVRDREFPDIGVETQGEMLRGHASYSYPGWGGLSGTYTYTQDEYTDRVAGYNVTSHVVTARADVERIPNLRFGTGVTYLDFREGVDIEKSVVFLEAAYTVARDYHLEVKYNVYNYDDYVLLDRYYTANAVWFNVAYDFHVD